MNKKINVLVVDDSLVDQMLLVHIMNSDPRLHVIGTADNGVKAIALSERLNPDVIVMDVTMPNMDGLETTARIMQSKPVPIVVCTGLHAIDPTISFKAIEAGALALVGKPEGPGHENFHALARSLTDTLVLMSEIRLVRRWSRLKPGARSAVEETKTVAPKPAWSLPTGLSAAATAGSRISPGLAGTGGSRSGVRLVAIGASTGGPLVLQTLLARLPRDFPVPLLVVQHITPGFLQGMASWLQLTTGFPVCIAQHNETPLPGHAYLAPDNQHLGVNPAGAIVLSRAEPMDRICPSVSHLFHSIAATPFASNVVGVLLTGMGRDGAEELKTLKDLGAITIAQDAESSVVHGMPGEAIRIGGATHVLAPENIAAWLGGFARLGTFG